ncbi:hypothetical protein QCN29_21610 [Streptomyces sp. HNM0663]|uniref:DUF4386 family protein n=1 Tax=Streptomyces chengmaiensis TaxID=3040919 RepID=A0ABT6HRJ0_9ACTN|nr:hypothetical protein [Streptomyces chengmaiensis]MDH2391333.1 hypothetical protein [Streptomyces chengmaiensis]
MTASQSVEVTSHKDVWPGIAGVVSGGLLIAVQALWYRTPDTGDRGAIRDVVLFYADDGNRDLAEATALMTLLASLLFLFFLVALARLAGNRSHQVLLGGVAFTVLLLVAVIAGNVYAITVDYSDVFPVAPQTALIAILLLEVQYAGMVAAMVAAAVMLFAVWRVATAAQAAPPWLGWSAFAVAVVCLVGPITAWLTPLLLGVWLIAAGVLMILRSREETAGHTAAGHTGPEPGPAGPGASGPGTAPPVPGPTQGGTQGPPAP